MTGADLFVVLSPGKPLNIRFARISPAWRARAAHLLPDPGLMLAASWLDSTNRASRRGTRGAIEAVSPSRAAADAALALVLCPLPPRRGRAWRVSPATLRDQVAAARRSDRATRATLVGRTVVAQQRPSRQHPVRQSILRMRCGHTRRREAAAARARIQGSGPVRADLGVSPIAETEPFPRGTAARTEAPRPARSTHPPVAGRIP